MYLFYVSMMLTFGAAEGLMASVAAFYAIELFKKGVRVFGWELGSAPKI